MYFYEGNDIGDNILALMFDENRFKIKNLKNENLTKKKFEYCLETEIRKDVAVVTPYLVSAKFYLGLLYNAIDKISYKVNHIYSKPSYQEPKIVLINTSVIDKQIIHLPELQGPALEFQKEEIDDAIQVFEYSIESLHEKFPNSKIVTVYIPSVLSCYSFKGNVFIETSCPNCKFHDFSYPQDMVLKRSDEIVRRIQNVCKEQNIKFLDSRSYMRQAALRGPIHGPNDWGHFNKYGYTKFSEYITLFLQKEEL